MKIYYVEGQHFHTPGVVHKVYSSLIEAQKEALELVNLLRDWVDLPPAIEPTEWETARKEARMARYASLHGMGIDDVPTDDFADPDGLDLSPDDDGFVSIEEYEVLDVHVAQAA